MAGAHDEKATRSGPRAPVIRVFDCHVARQTPQGSLQFLLLERARDKIYAGSWRMVGGKLRDDETAWQGCLRELREETRLPIARLLSVPFVNRFYEWQHDRINDIPVFVALTDGATPILDAEHSDFAWLELDAALARLHWPGQRDGLRAAHQLLKVGHPLQPLMEIALPAD